MLSLPLLLKYFILFATGIVTGSMNAVAGGGMFVGFPILVATGLPTLIANATGKVVVLPGQAAAAFGYRPLWREIPRRYFLLFIPAVVGGGLGAFLLRQTSVQTFSAFVPFLMLAAVLLFALQPEISTLLKKERRRTVLPFSFLVVGVFMVSFYGGYFGIGFGFVMLTLLAFSGLKSIYYMNALKNMSAAVMLVVVVAILAPGSLIDWPAGLAMAAGTAVGGYGGARLASKMPTRLLRFLIILFGLLSVWYFFTYHPL